MSVEVVPVPFARDNFAYLLVAGREAVVVDPGEAAPVLAVVHARGLSLVAVWCTHHHGDHVGGVGAVRASVGDVPVVGSAQDAALGRIPRLTRAVSDGAALDGPGGSAFRALHVPGHTLGALSFVGEGHAFVGDTLFGAGCGRVFEGTLGQMAGSLARLGALAPETRLWWGHAYTAANLRWLASASRAHGGEFPVPARVPGEPDTGGTVAEELATNVFLRAACHTGAYPLEGALGELVARLAMHDVAAGEAVGGAEEVRAAGVHAFALLRRAKDRG